MKLSIAEPRGPKYKQYCNNSESAFLGNKKLLRVFPFRTTIFATALVRSITIDHGLLYAGLQKRD